MEPGLGGQEKAKGHAMNSDAVYVAMEPGLGGQEKLLEVSHPSTVGGVAMEPGLGGQEKLGGSSRRSLLHMSQWSLALAARKR